MIEIIKEHLKDISPVYTDIHAYYILENNDIQTLQLVFAETPLEALEYFYNIDAKKLLIPKRKDLTYENYLAISKKCPLMFCEDNLDNLLYGCYISSCGVLIGEDFKEKIFEIEEYLKSRRCQYIGDSESRFESEIKFEEG